MYSHIDEQVYSVEHPDVYTKTALFYAHCYQRAVRRSSAVSQSAFSPFNSPELPRVVTISAGDVGGAGSEPSPPAFPHFSSRPSHARRTVEFLFLWIREFPFMHLSSTGVTHSRTPEKERKTFGNGIVEEETEC